METEISVNRKIISQLKETESETYKSARTEMKLKRNNVKRKKMENINIDNEMEKFWKSFKFDKESCT